MGLALNFEQSGDGKILKVTDKSETWGDDLPNIEDVSSADLIIDFEDKTYTIDLTNSNDDWDTTFGDTGATQDDLVWEVTTDMLDSSLDSVFLDGVYTVTYSVEGVDDDVQYNTLLSHNVRSCVYQILRQIPDVHRCDICSNSEVQRAIFMFTYLKSMEYSAACGQINEIKTILSSLQRLCKNPYINECYCN